MTTAAALKKGTAYRCESEQAIKNQNDGARVNRPVFAGNFVI